MTIPDAPGRLPLLGHTLSVLRDPLAFLTSLPARGDLVQVRLGPVQALVVCDPGLTRQVLLDDRTFDKGGLLFDRGRELGGNGLALCPHSDHRRQRRLAQPAFHPSRFPAYARTMVARATAAAESWRPGTTIELGSEAMTLAVRTAIETMFSDALAPDALRQSTMDLAVVMKGLYRRMALPPSWERRLTRTRYHQARTRLRHTLDGVIAQRQASGEDHGDLLSAFLTARDTDGHGLTDTEISDQVLTFFIAGADSTAVLLSWALALLAHHPEVQDRVHAEAVLAGSPATYDHLPRLDLTSRVVAETLRLYPPGWMLTRTVTTDTTLGRHHIPAGTTIVYSPYLIHRRADLHESPDEFDPDRPRSDRHAYLPFGAGARKCIADQFGLTEAVLTLATITSHRRLVPLSPAMTRPAAAATLNPRRMRMHVTAR
ncbi:cytochrome P450 [Lentzea sp. NPDC059081]|uniref:cytochrome P450 n=1 Tax=Lentzea sp. NPDC059081 TaxID=3346719 RepID=UPI0036C6B9C1